MKKGLLLTALVAAAALAHGASASPLEKGEAAIRAAALAAPMPPTTTHELGMAMGYLIKHTFELFDQDKDGSLTFDEFLEYHFASYLVFNVERDGRLTFEEYRESYAGPPAHPFTIPHPSDRDIERRFHALDRAKKGYLTIDDFREEAMQYFRANDVNRDGRVTQEEMDEVARGGRPR
jgi:Ca2+-binding EF-hand superfamily protein